MRRYIRISAGFGMLIVLAQVTLAAGLFEKSEYAARRSRLMAKIPDGVAVFLGAASSHSDREFRQGHDFAYFTGVQAPDAFLVIDGLRRESTLFLTLTEGEALGEGLPVDLARKPKEFTGIERVLSANAFGGALTDLSRRVRAFYTMFRPEELGPENSNEKFGVLQRTMTLSAWDGRLTRELQFVKHIRDRFPEVDVRDCSALVWDLRKVKTPAELEALRRAARVGVEGHRALIQSTRPGVSERSLAAVFEFACRSKGATEMAYEPIIMSGKNHAYGHYHAYDRVLQAGDFVILDAGPDVGDYHADISTTFPASGTFTPRQKELYTAALAALEACEANYRPGLTFAQVGEKVAVRLKELGLVRFAKDFEGVFRYGGYNHMIGLATHDVTGTFAGPGEVLVPGLVFACDIQLFRLEEEVGIRLEDTVAVTPEGCEVLSRGVPRTVEDVEALMRTEGLLQMLRKSGLESGR